MATAPIHATTAKYFPRALVSLRWAVIAFALLALIGAAPAAFAVAGPTFQGGSGSAADPYLIADANQLSRFRDTVNAGEDYAGKVVALAGDVDLAGVEWAPIGAGVRSGSGIAAGSTPFRGTFDGAGHTVRGLSLTMSPASDAAVGLFGVVDGGTVGNVTLENASVNVPGSELAGAAVGLLAGNGTVSGVKVSGTVSGLAGVGGVVGRMTLSGTISGCENAASVTAATGKGNVGGIVGAAYYTDDTGEMVIEHCVNRGAVKGTQAVGGIAGLSSAFLSDCSNEGAVEALNYGAGGIVGDQKNYGALHGCRNSGEVSCAAAKGYGTGGIAGWIRYDGAAPAYSASAAVPVTGCENSGAVRGGNDAGGIVGTLYDAGLVTGCENTAPALSAATFAGGIVGNLQSEPGSVPSSVVGGITVENNVSTTPLDAMDAPLRDAFAYNNTPAAFTVRDNGSAWQAATGPVRYAVLQRAVDSAADGDVVKLAADVAGAPALTLSDGRTVTLDLAGHRLAFDEAPGLSVEWGTLVVTGEGFVSVPAEAGAIAAVAGAAGKPAALSLEGGSYSADVAPYVADGCAELVRAGAAAHGPAAAFSVLPADEARHAARAAVERDGRTVYYESADEARAAAAGDPAAKVTELPDGEPAQPEEPGSPSAPDEPGETGEADDPAAHEGEGAGAGDGTGAASGGDADDAASGSEASAGGSGTAAAGAGAPRGGSAYRGSTAKSFPQTGDSASDVLWGALAAAGASAAALALARARIGNARR